MKCTFSTRLTLVYLRNDSITSGALYQRVATSKIGQITLVLTRRPTLGHDALVPFAWSSRLRTPSETKVAHFEVAIGIQQEVGGFQVTVNDWRQR